MILYWPTILSTLLILSALGQERSVAAKDPIRLEPGRKQPFLDDHLVERTQNLEQVVHRPTKRGSVLLPDQP